MFRPVIPRTPRVVAYWGIGALLCALLSGLAASATSGAPSTSATPQSAPDLMSKALTRLNEYRALMKIPIVREDPALSAAARPASSRRRMRIDSNK